MGTKEIVASLIITAAVSVCTAFADKFNRQHSARQLIDMYQKRTFIIFVSCIFATIALLYGINKWSRNVLVDEPRYDFALRARNFTYPALGGIFGGCCATLLKSAISIVVSETKMSGLGAVFGDWLFYVLIIFLAFFWIGQIFWINRGVQVVDTIFLVPIECALDAVTGTVGGLFYFNEENDMKQPDLAWFSLGIVCVLIGLGLLSTRNPSETTNYDNIAKRHKGSDPWDEDNTGDNTKDIEPLLRRRTDQSS